MRVHLDGINVSSSSGPNTFARRLSAELVEQGHDIVGSGPQADVSLVFIEPTGQPLAPKVIQRLDGVWFSPTEFHTKNVGIKALYGSADAVIWQSEFDRSFVTTWWGEPKRGSVIRNGVKLAPVTEFTDGALAKIRSEYETVFVCSASWHKQKRLYDNTELFLDIRHRFYKNSCLIVLGPHPDYTVADPHIFYGANVTEETFMQVFSMADWMIHLAWCDHCPNTVIECLSQGTPVICSEDGGTKELVGGFGLVLNEKKPFQNQLAHYDRPPAIDLWRVTVPLPQKQALGAHADIDIVNVARRYVEVFESVL